MISKLSVVEAIERGSCPVCAVDLGAPLTKITRTGAGLGTTHLPGERICPNCDTGWRAWRTLRLGISQVHYAQVGGTLGPRPE